MVSEENLTEIIGLFNYLQLIGSGASAQDYNKADAYRTNTLIAVRKRKKIDYVFVNVPVKMFTPWRKRKWDERKANIKLESFMLETKHPDIIRLGFK